MERTLEENILFIKKKANEVQRSDNAFHLEFVANQLLSGCITLQKNRYPFKKRIEKTVVDLTEIVKFKEVINAWNYYDSLRTRPSAENHRLILESLEVAKARIHEVISPFLQQASVIELLDGEKNN